MISMPTNFLGASCTSSTLRARIFCHWRISVALGSLIAHFLHTAAGPPITSTLKEAFADELRFRSTLPSLLCDGYWLPSNPWPHLTKTRLTITIEKGAPNLFFCFFLACHFKKFWRFSVWEVSALTLSDTQRKSPVRTVPRLCR